jgi:hypothetical protein
MKFLIYGLIVLAATVYGMYKLFLVNFAVNDFTFRITDLKKLILLQSQSGVTNE